MPAPLCPRHAVPLNRIDREEHLLRCPVPGCEWSLDLTAVQYGAGQAPDYGGLDRRPACEQPAPMPADNPLLQRAQGYWLSHLGLKGPISQVPQSNARADWSVMSGPPAPGGGGGGSGRRRKKNRKGNKKFQFNWDEGGTCK